MEKIYTILITIGLFLILLFVALYITSSGLTSFFNFLGKFSATT